MHKGLLHTAHENVSEEELEGQVDWRTEGAVSDVKDQGEFLFILIKNTPFFVKSGQIGSLNRSFNFNRVKFGRKITILTEFRSNTQCLSHFFRRKYIRRKT